jgi:hypothetical protein
MISMQIRHPCRDALGTERSLHDRRIQISPTRCPMNLHTTDPGSLLPTPLRKCFRVALPVSAPAFHGQLRTAAARVTESARQCGHSIVREPLYLHPLGIARSAVLAWSTRRTAATAPATSRRSCPVLMRQSPLRTRTAGTHSPACPPGRWPDPPPKTPRRPPFGSTGVALAGQPGVRPATGCLRESFKKARK